jgi:GGDEF domain-containing protein
VVHTLKAALRGCLRPNDTARLGGDDFLPRQTAIAAAREIASQLLEVVRQTAARWAFASASASVW